MASHKLYGKWEDKVANLLPLLDACGAHFGPTPDSNDTIVYHYHVQDKAPFTVGCYGPTADNRLVGVAACRALYTECSNAAEDVIIGRKQKVKYVRGCPCWDADGTNTGPINELPALNTTNISQVCVHGCRSAEGSTAESTEARTSNAGFLSTGSAADVSR